MNVIHFGAGNIGKGFIANVLSHNGFHVCFVDVDKSNIATIRKEKQYCITVLEEQPKIVDVKNISILDGVNEQQQIIDKICEVDLITTSVGVNNLVTIAPVIRKGLIARFAQHRSPINIIANENAINATNILKQAIIQKLPEENTDILASVGFVNSAIDRQAVSMQQNSITMTAVEPFWEWVINQKEMIGEQIPKIENVTYVDDLQPYIEKKLYIVNLGHAALAYLGFIANKETIFNVLSHSSLRQFVQFTMQDSAKYLATQYAFSEAYLLEYIENTLTRFANPHLKDGVLRVAKSPIRKLGPNDRLIGPLLQLYRLDLPIKNLCKVIAMALLFNNKQDLESVALQDFIQQHGVEKTIEHYCQIQEKAMITIIKHYYHQFLSITQDYADPNRLTRIEHILFNE